MYTITIQNKKANFFGQIQYTKTEPYVKSFFDKNILLRKAVFIQGRLEILIKIRHIPKMDSKKYTKEEKEYMKLICKK